MAPKRDFNDYTKFINDSFMHEKHELLLHTMDLSSARKTQQGPNYNPFESLKAPSHQDDYLSRRKAARSNNKFAFTEKKRDHSNQDFYDVDVNARILESKVSSQKDFFALSDGFKKVFSSDLSDQKMVIPISGFGGHRRGDRSQNFFGKCFRETSLLSKKLQRDMQSPITHR